MSCNESNICDKHIAYLEKYEGQIVSRLQAHLFLFNAGGLAIIISFLASLKSSAPIDKTLMIVAVVFDILGVLFTLFLMGVDYIRNQRLLCQNDRRYDKFDFLVGTTLGVASFICAVLGAIFGFSGFMQVLRVWNSSTSYIIIALVMAIILVLTLLYFYIGERCALKYEVGANK